MPLFRLEAIDGQDQGIDMLVGFGQQRRILLPCRDHELIALYIVREGILGQHDLIRVAQLQAQLRNGPVPGEPAMSKPAEDIPADGPMRQGELRFRQRAEGPVRAGTFGNGAMDQLADQRDRPIEGVDAMEAVIADL